jgi:copper chaperone
MVLSSSEAVRLLWLEYERDLAEESAMEFRIPDMSCGHCASRVTAALRALDPAAVVEVDLASHRVVTQGRFDAPAALEALTGAGFTPGEIPPASG